MPKDTNANRPADKPQKKAYTRPTVRAYGNVREITQATGGAGKRDSPTRNTKTGL
jgi:hypothetical protein